jgi:hypothetical protein
MTARLRHRFRIALVALCAVLFAQWSLAAHACPVIGQAGELIAQAQWVDGTDPAGADATVAPDHHASSEPSGAFPCHDAADPAADSTLCVKHCTDESSLTGAGSAGTVAPAMLSALRVPAPAPADLLRWDDVPASGDTTSPPLLILYCVSLT